MKRIHIWTCISLSWKSLGKGYLNQYTTRPIVATIDNSGSRIGMKYDVPILITVGGGCAGVLCSYVFMISRESISKAALFRAIGMDDKKRFSTDPYRQICETLACSERINAFTELMYYIDRDEKFSKLTRTMVQNTKIYGESFKSSRVSKRKGCVRFMEDLTLSAAKKYTGQGRHVAVLSFANPVEPGGGVFRGAKAQEENICRSSNLHKALASRQASYFYTVHNSIIRENQFQSMLIGTDMVIYSPNVMILKDNVDYRPGLVSACREEYISQPYFVDVITCAAPFFSSSKYILPNGDLQHLFERRIKNIFEVAIDNDVEVLILGAFGCGAFHNPPDVVADAFRVVLLEQKYSTAFDEVVFAVKRTGSICPNIEAFERNFSMFPSINNNGNERVRRSTEYAQAFHENAY